MKRKSLSVVSLLVVPSVHSSPYSSIDMAEIGSSRSSKSNQVAASDPFENLRYTSKKTPSLRPILNRHHKSPSCGNLQIPDRNFIKPISKSLNQSKDGHALPSIFRKRKHFKKNALFNLPSLAHNSAQNSKDREISTPYFKPHPSESANMMKIGTNHKSRARFFDHSRHCSQPEFSFGENLNKQLFNF